MTEAYEQRAVAALEGYLAANLPASLRVVEIEAGYAPNQLRDPVRYVRALTPGDNGTPLVMIFDEGCAPAVAGDRNNLGIVDCTVAIAFSHTSNVEEGEDYVRRYAQAIRRAIRLDHTLGGLVAQAVWTDSQRTSPFDDDSMIRHARALGFSVHVHDT